MSGDGSGGSPQDRYYERYAQNGGSTPGPTGPGRGSARWLIFAGVAVLILIVATASVVFFGGVRSDSDAASSSSPTDAAGQASGPSTGDSTSAEAPSTSAGGPLTVRPVVPGWQAVGGVVNDVNTIYGAYDAPPSWGVYQSGSVEYKDDSGSRGRHTDWGLSTYNEKKCAGNPGVVQASASFIDIGKRDPAEALGAILPSFGRAISMNADKTTNAAQGLVTLTNTRVASGSVSAVRGKLVVTQGTLNKDCGTGQPHTLHAAAFTGNGRSVMLLIAVATWPNEKVPDDATIDKIIGSLRPAGG